MERIYIIPEIITLFNSTKNYAVIIIAELYESYYLLWGNFEALGQIVLFSQSFP